MATVEIDTGKHVKRYDFWNPATWAIPKLYWDAFSQEQRIHAICRQLEKVIRYADYVGVNVDDIAQRLQAIEDGKLDAFITEAIENWFEQHEPEIANAIEELQTSVEAINSIIPIENFTPESTIKDAIDEANEDISQANEDILTLNNAVAHLTDASKLGKTINPVYMGSTPTEPDKLSCCCRVDDEMVCISTDDYSAAGGTIRVYDLSSNEQLYKRTNQVVGHANSICYNEIETAFYLAPMATYNEGTRVFIEKLYKYNTTFSAMQEIDAPEMIYGVSYDPINQTMWAFAQNEIDSVKFYKVENDQFELYSTLPFAELNEKVIQDFAVSDNCAYLAMPEGTLYVIPLKETECHVLQTAFISQYDAGGIWRYGEVQGIEFDKENRLYNARVNFDSVKSSTQRTNVTSGFVTELKFANNAEVSTLVNQGIGRTYNVLEDYQRETKFKLSSGELRSLNNANWITETIRTIQYNGGTVGNEKVYTEGAVKYARDDELSIMIWGYANVSIDFIDSDGGIIGILVQPNAVLNCGCGNSDNAFILSNPRQTITTLRNRGTINIEQDDRFTWFGFFPGISILEGLGNLTQLKFNDYVVTNQYAMLVGNAVFFESN